MSGGITTALRLCFLVFSLGKIELVKAVKMTGTEIFTNVGLFFGNYGVRFL